MSSVAFVAVTYSALCSVLSHWATYILIYWQVGMGTEVDTFTGTDRMTSVLPGISSLKNERYLVSILLNAPLAGRVRNS